MEMICNGVILMEFEESVKKEEQIEEKEQHIEQKEQDQKVDRFTELMFGRRPNMERKEHEIKPENTVGDDVNYFTIMEQIGDIMNSIDNLKPVLKEFSPIIDYIKKKI